MTYHEYPPHMLRRTYLAAMKQGHRFDCGLCGVVIGKVRYLTIDHIVPKSKGGSDEYDNLQPAHLICNQRKADEEPELQFDVYRPQPRLKLQNTNG